MSLESGKKLGFIASLLNVIVPPIMFIAVIGLYASIFSSLLNSISNNVTSLAPSFAFFGTIIVVVLVGAILSLVAYILFLISMHGLSKHYNEPIIFGNLIKAFIIQIVFAVVLVVLFFAFFSISSVTIGTSAASSAPSFALSILGLYAVVIVISLVVSIYCALLYKRSFDRLAEKSGVDEFKTTGLLYFIGTVLTIVAIGSIIIWIGWIFAAMGYRKLAPASPMTAPFSYSPNQSQPPVVGQTNRCSVCGAENSPDSIYCRSCGRPLR